MGLEWWCCWPCERWWWFPWHRERVGWPQLHWVTLDKETPLYCSSGKFQLESDGLFVQTTLFRVYSKTLHYLILGDFRDHTTLLWDSRSMVRIQLSRPEALRRHAPKAIGRRAPRNFECRLTLLKLLSSIKLLWPDHSIRYVPNTAFAWESLRCCTDCRPVPLKCIWRTHTAGFRLIITGR